MPIPGTSSINEAILIARPVMLYAQVLAVILRPFNMLARLVLTYRNGHTGKHNGIIVYTGFVKQYCSKSANV